MGPSATLVGCHECDALSWKEFIPPGARAHCARCGNTLYQHIPDSINRATALYLASLMLWVMANVMPFLSLKVGGRIEETLLITGGVALWNFGMPELGTVVFLTSVAFPLIGIVGTLYLLVSAQFRIVPPLRTPVFRLITAIEPWTLVGIFFLGTLISIVKLQDMATVIPGMGFYSFGLLLIFFTAARANLDKDEFWFDHPQATQAELDRLDRVLHCHACGMLQADNVSHHCVRCDTHIHHRIENSINKTWSLLFAAAIMLIPANIYPVMTISKLGSGEPSTIISGVILLMDNGLYGLAIIVLFASIVVPVAKLGTLSFLLYSVQKGIQWRPRDRTFLYRVTEVIGAWSMVDVFLVALLSGLVSLGFLATIEPGVGASFFGGAVILTMFAAHSFDSRLLWDGLDARKEETG